jgi:hypothetical protein
MANGWKDPHVADAHAGYTLDCFASGSQWQWFIAYGHQITNPYATPSFFCRLVEEVVYWKVSFLSG